jgi:hypothetical protein
MTSILAASLQYGLFLTWNRDPVRINPARQKTVLTGSLKAVLTDPLISKASREESRTGSALACAFCVFSFRFIGPRRRSRRRLHATLLRSRTERLFPVGPTAELNRLHAGTIKADGVED